MKIPLVGLFAAACGSSTLSVDVSCLPTPAANSDTLSKGFNIVFAIVASMAVLMIVIGGFRYIAAHGDPNSTTQARNTILYAVVGLVVTMVAFSIVTFVVKGIG